MTATDVGQQTSFRVSGMRIFRAGASEELTAFSAGPRTRER